MLPAGNCGQRYFETMSDTRPLKPFLSIEEQAEKILARKCIGDKDFIIEKLRFVNYYRLAGYLYPFRKRRAADGFVEDEFEEGTTFAQVWDLYRFDRRMRFLLIDAIERIEIALRTCIAYRWAESCAHKGISNPQGKSNCYRNPETFKRLLSKVQEQYSSSKERCAIHYNGAAWNISKAEDLPVWVFVEFTTFANLKTLCEKCLKHKVAQSVAADFGFADREKFCARCETPVRTTACFGTSRGKKKKQKHLSRRICPVLSRTHTPTTTKSGSPMCFAVATFC